MWTPYIKRWLPLLLWMGLIFYLSSRSDPFVLTPPGWEKDCRSLASGLTLSPLQCRDEYLGRLAHILEYAILALLFYRAWVWRSPLKFTLLGAFAYALSDEIHQLFVPGRASQIPDLLLDLLGILIGLGLVLIINRSERVPGYKQ